MTLKEKALQLYLDLQPNWPWPRCHDAQIAWSEGNCCQEMREHCKKRSEWMKAVEEAGAETSSPKEVYAAGMPELAAHMMANNLGWEIVPG